MSIRVGRKGSWSKLLISLAAVWGLLVLSSPAQATDDGLGGTLGSGIDWVSTFDIGGAIGRNDIVAKIAVDPTYSYIYVIGPSWNGSDYDYVTIQYNITTGAANWQKKYAGSGNGEDIAIDMAVVSGAVYVTGKSWNGTDYDFVTIKYDEATGNTAAGWPQTFAEGASGDPDLPAHDVPTDIFVDGSGNVYVTGESVRTEAGECDASGEICSDSVSHYDFATVKYNSGGVQQWAATYDGFTDSWACGGDPPVVTCQGNGRDTAKAVAADSSGNVYVAGLATLTSSDYSDPEGDCVIIKYNSAGTAQWNVKYGAVGGKDEPYFLQLDGSGNVYVTGLKYGGGFDAEGNRTGSDYDFFTVKFDTTDGTQLWEDTYDGTWTDSYDEPYGLAMDASGNLYVTGVAVMGTTVENVSENYITIKYNSSGNRQWVAEYDNPGGGASDRALGVAISNDVTYSGAYVTGTSNNSYKNIKYTLAGTYEWTVIYNKGDFNIAKSVTVDSTGHAYIVGVSGDESAGYDLVTLRDAPRVDTDQDGMDDDWEIAHGLDPLNDADATGEPYTPGDPDGDGLTNVEEYSAGADPHDQDTDDDGMDDKWEVDYGLDPAVDDAAEDADEDGYTNLMEYGNSTNPTLVEATLYYVDASVTASGIGSSWDTAFKTIAEALTEAETTTGKVIVRVAAGTYSPPGGNLVVPVEVALMGAGWNECSIDLQGSLRIQLGSSSLLSGFNISNPSATQHVIEANGASSVSITNNVIQGSSTYQEPDTPAAIFLNNSSGRVENNTIDGGHTGILVDGGGAGSIVVVTVYNNIVIDNEAAWGTTNADGNDSITVDYNNFVGVTPTANNISGDPLFVDAADGNYHLQKVPTQSPCIDAGNPDAAYRDKDSSTNDMGADGGQGGMVDTTVPGVAVSADPTSGDALLEVWFTGTASDEWGIASWAWDFDGLNGFQTESTAQNPSYIYDACGGYIVTLTVTDHSGLSASATKNINVSPTTVNISAEPIAATISSNITFDGSATSGPSEFYTWVWDFGDGITQENDEQIATVGSTVHSYAEVGNYTVTLTVTDEFGCQTPTTIPITVVDDSCSIQVSQLVAGNLEDTVVVSDPGSGVKVSIPGAIGEELGALSNDTVITISTVTDPLSFPAGISGIGVPVDFGPNGTNFSQNVTVNIPYTDADLIAAGIDDPNDLRVYYYDTGTTRWVELEVTGVDTSNKIISAQTDHFTLYGLGGGVPTPPTSLTATAASASQINLSWTDNSSDESGFRIERKPAGGTYAEIATVGAGITSYQSGDLTGGSEYCYRVRAYNAYGNSEFTNEACATTPVSSAKGTAQTSDGGGGGGGGGCFIATAAYGTPMAGQVRILSRFRDEYLLTNTLGRRFVAFYYEYSPPIADYIAQSEFLRKTVRVSLWPLLGFGWFMLELGLGEKLGIITILLVTSGYLIRRKRRRKPA